MRKEKRNIGLKVAAILLIFSVGLWTASKSIFQHAHVMPDGEIVYHAHPYNKSSDSAPFKQHKHTDAQLAVIDNFNAIILSILTVFSVLPFVRLIKHAYIFSFVSEYKQKHINGRAPPVILCK